MDERGVSTIVDISLALLLVSASLIVMGFFLLPDQPEPNRLGDERAANTLSETTATAEYTLEPVTRDPLFSTAGYSDAALQRERYGTATALLADAAVTAVEVDGTPLTAEGSQFARAAQGTVRNITTSFQNRNVRVVAIWRPYEGSNMQGELSAGPQVPGDARVQVSTIRVDSGIPAVENSRLEAAFGSSSDFDAVGDLLAERIVAGYFPVTDTQLALERDRLDRALAVYRYRKMAAVVDGFYDPDFDVTDPANMLSRRGADAAAANDELGRGLGALIADDLRSTFDPGIDAEELAAEISIQDVSITVYRWRE